MAASSEDMIRRQPKAITADSSCYLHQNQAVHAPGDVVRVEWDALFDAVHGSAQRAVRRRRDVKLRDASPPGCIESKSDPGFLNSTSDRVY
jgi:hypothetical protein